MNLERLIPLLLSLFESLIQTSVENEGVVVFGHDDIVTALKKAMNDNHLTVREFVDILEAISRSRLFN